MCRIRLLLCYCCAFLLPGCDALSDTTGLCEGGEQPDLPLHAYAALGAGTFMAEARGEALSGAASFRVDSVVTGGERRAVGVVELGETSEGVIRIESSDLLNVESGEAVSVSVRYADAGGSDVPFSGGGDLFIRRSTASEVEGVFASCTARQPFSALWPQKARVEGGFRAERR